MYYYLIKIFCYKDTRMEFFAQYVIQFNVVTLRPLYFDEFYLQYLSPLKRFRLLPWLEDLRILVSTSSVVSDLSDNSWCESNLTLDSNSR